MSSVCVCQTTNVNQRTRNLFKAKLIHSESVCILQVHQVVEKSVEKNHKALLGKINERQKRGKRLLNKLLLLKFLVRSTNVRFFHQINFAWTNRSFNKISRGIPGELQRGNFSGLKVDLIHKLLNFVISEENFPFCRKKINLSNFFPEKSSPVNFYRTRTF